MGIGTSLVTFAIGAILRFAVTAHATGFNIRTVGDVLMIVAAVGFVFSLVFWRSFGSYGTSWSSRATTVSRSGAVNDPQDMALRQSGQTVVTQTRTDQDNRL
jgi:hypothetical protein